MACREGARGGVQEGSVLGHDLKKEGSEWGGDESLRDVAVRVVII